MNRSRRRHLLGGGVVWLALLGGAGPASAQGLEIIELRHRPAEQILPVVAPLAGSGGSVTGSGFTLIVRGSPAAITQIRQVVASLDRAARQLLISVRQDLGAASSSSGAGAQVVLSPGGSRVAGGVWDRTATSQDNVSQQVRTLEGQSAYVQTGTSALVPQRSVARTAGGVVVQETVVERNLNTGVWVTPRLAGEQVFLEVSAQRDAALAGAAGVGVAGPAGAASTNRIATTVSGRLGEWIELGGTSQAASVDSRGLLARSSDAGASERRVWVRVEEVR